MTVNHDHLAHLHTFKVWNEYFVLNIPKSKIYKLMSASYVLSVCYSKENRLMKLNWNFGGQGKLMSYDVSCEIYKYEKELSYIIYAKFLRGINHC